MNTATPPKTTCAPMPYAIARHHADKIVQWLTPYCERIEVCGSVRRIRPKCGDIDLVVIPKITVKQDLFGAPDGKVNHCWLFLSGYCQAPQNNAILLSGGQPDTSSMSVQLRKCQLDVWFATEATWSTLVLSKTGSRDHNIWLAGRAQDRGLHWQPSVGIQKRHDGTIETLPAPATEADLYLALGLKLIDPRNRELDWLRKNIEFGL